MVFRLAIQLGIDENLITYLDTAILRAPVSALGVGNWHTIRLVRRKSRGRLDVDGRTVAKARSSGPEDLFLEGPLFIGGVKFWDFVSEKLNIREGFTGCIESVITYEQNDSKIAKKMLEKIRFLNHYDV